MKLAGLVFLFVLTRVGGQMDPSCTESRVLDCLFNYLDANADGSITAAEISGFNITDTCTDGSEEGVEVHNVVKQDQLNGDEIMAICDINHDGVLTMDDATDLNPCLHSMGICRLICMQCDYCDLAMNITVV